MTFSTVVDKEMYYTKAFGTVASKEMYCSDSVQNAVTSIFVTAGFLSEHAKISHGRYCIADTGFSNNHEIASDLNGQNGTRMGSCFVDAEHANARRLYGGPARSYAPARVVQGDVHNACLTCHLDYEVGRDNDYSLVRFNICNVGHAVCRGCALDLLYRNRQEIRTLNGLRAYTNGIIRCPLCFNAGYTLDNCVVLSPRCNIFQNVNVAPVPPLSDVAPDGADTEIESARRRQGALNVRLFIDRIDAIPRPELPPRVAQVAEPAPEPVVPAPNVAPALRPPPIVGIGNRIPPLPPFINAHVGLLDLEPPYDPESEDCIGHRLDLEEVKIYRTNKARTSWLLLKIALCFLLVLSAIVYSGYIIHTSSFTWLTEYIMSSHAVAFFIVGGSAVIPFILPRVRVFIGLVFLQMKGAVFVWKSAINIDDVQPSRLSGLLLQTNDSGDATSLLANKGYNTFSSEYVSKFLVRECVAAHIGHLANSHLARTMLGFIGRSYPKVMRFHTALAASSTLHAAQCIELLRANEKDATISEVYSLSAPGFKQN